MTEVAKAAIIQGYDNGSQESPMFEAILYVCLVAAPEECVELNDVRGPYTNEVDCMKRVDEMAEFAIEVNLFDLNIRWKCTAPEGLQT